MGGGQIKPQLTLLKIFDIINTTKKKGDFNYGRKEDYKGRKA